MNLLTSLQNSSSYFRFTQFAQAPQNYLRVEWKVCSYFHAVVCMRTSVLSLLPSAQEQGLCMRTSPVVRLMSKLNITCVAMCSEDVLLRGAGQLFPIGLKPEVLESACSGESEAIQVRTLWFGFIVFSSVELDRMLAQDQVSRGLGEGQQG